MAEILSQQEIDSLLSGIPVDEPKGAPIPVPGTKTEREVITFDFRLPHRLSKNQLRTLQAVHENFSEAFSSYLLSRLQTTVGVVVTSVDQLFYSEYVLSIPSPSCLYVFRISDTDAFALLEFSPQLVMAMVSRLLGGSTDGEKRARQITKIEQSIIKGIAQRALVDLQKSWKTIADFNFKIERYENEGDFAQIAPTSEIVLVVSFEVSFGDQKFLMGLCFPTFALEEELAKLNVQHFNALPGAKSQGDWSDQILKNIGHTAIEAVGVLGSTTITLRDLLELEVGDILKTNLPISGEVQVTIGNRPRLWGRPGVSNGRTAIKVARIEIDGKQGA